MHDNESDVAALLSKYGESSAAALLVKFYRLIEAVKQEYMSFERPRTEIALAALRDHYALLSTQLLPSPHKHHVRKEFVNGVEINSYNPGQFTKEAGQQAASFVRELNSPDAEFIHHGAFYLYAVTPDKRLMISAKAIPIVDLFFRTNPGNISHAHLVAQTGLSALCAGEVVFVKNDSKIVSSILNNRSGHFLPTRNALNNVLPTLAGILGIPKDNVFGLAIDRSL